MVEKYQKPVKKRGVALWRTVDAPGFKAQAAQLHPEKHEAGGVKARSAPKAVMDAIYSEIAKLFKHAYPWCEACVAIRNVHASSARETEDVHHKRGKVGLLLFDVRHFIPVCRTCHDWIGDNPEKARELGLLCEKGQWNALKE